MKLTKKRKEAEAKFDLSKSYPLNEACQMVKDMATTKFDSAVDVSVR